jgi:hypothetical protein
MPPSGAAENENGDPRTGFRCEEEVRPAPRFENREIRAEVADRAPFEFGFREPEHRERRGIDRGDRPLAAHEKRPPASDSTTSFRLPSDTVEDASFPAM